MPLINLTLEHHQTLAEAQAHLELAVNDVRRRLGPMMQCVEWSADRQAVKMAGLGAELEMRVDAVHVHVTGDLPGLGGLLGHPLVAGIKGLIVQAFQHHLPNRGSAAPAKKSDSAKS